jgi:tetratricopeptide (TPR) repeat protein
VDARLRSVAPRLDFARLASAGPDQPAPKPEAASLKAALAGNPDDFFANLQLGNMLRREKQDAAAEPYLKKAQQLFPEFTEAGNPYQGLGEIYLDQKRDEEALAQFLGWTRFDENAAPPLVLAAEIYRKRKDWPAMTKVLERAVYINPYDPKVHTLLGEAASESGNWATAAAAYQVLLGLNPADPAAAHLNLARAWLSMGKRQEARREVLRSLEIAPSFESAQQFLLKLSGVAP